MHTRDLFHRRLCEHRKQTQRTTDARRESFRMSHTARRDPRFEERGEAALSTKTQKQRLCHRSFPSEFRVKAKKTAEKARQESAPLGHFASIGTKRIFLGTCHRLCDSKGVWESSCGAAVKDYAADKSDWKNGGIVLRAGLPGPSKNSVTYRVRNAAFGTSPSASAEYSGSSLSTK